MYTRLVAGAGHANINRVYGALLTATAEHSTHVYSECACVCECVGVCAVV